MKKFFIATFLLLSSVLFKYSFAEPGHSLKRDYNWCKNKIKKIKTEFFTRYDFDNQEIQELLKPFADAGCMPACLAYSRMLFRQYELGCECEWEKLEIISKAMKYFLMAVRLEPHFFSMIDPKIQPNYDGAVQRRDQELGEPEPPTNWQMYKVGLNVRYRGVVFYPFIGSIIKPHDGFSISNWAQVLLKL